MGRFLSQKEMSNARHTQEVFNSMLKRGEVYNADKIVREHMVVCGCGVEGCMFVSLVRTETEEQKKQRFDHYGWNGVK